jgi:hypothetical protein
MSLDEGVITQRTDANVVSCVHIQDKWELVGQILRRLDDTLAAVRYPLSETEATPSLECTAGLNWPAVLWLSAGGTHFSFCAM